MSEKTLNPDLKRNLKIMGAVLGVLVLGGAAVVLLRSPDPQKTDPAGVSLQMTGAASPVPTTEPTSEAMRQLLREKQLAEAAENARKGRMYIPPDTEASVGLDGKPLRTNNGFAPITLTNAEANGSPYAGPNSGQPVVGGQLTPVAGGAGYADAGASEEERQRLERMRKGAEQQFKDIVAISGPAQRVERIDFSTGGTGQVAAGGPGGASPTASRGAALPSGTSAAVAAGPSIVDPLQIFAGVTSSPIDTYKTGYVSAKITSGALAGAFLTGRTEMVNEGLQPRFTMMRFEDKTYRINAIALDEKTGTDAVDANLDRRYWERFVMPIFLSGVTAYQVARATPGQQVVTSPTGTTVATPPPTRDQAIAAGVATGLGAAQTVVTAEARKPIRATLPANTMIGLMFLEPVTAASLVTTAPGSTSGSGAVLR